MSTRERSTPPRRSRGRCAAPACSCRGCSRSALVAAAASASPEITEFKSAARHPGRRPPGPRRQAAARKPGRTGGVEELDLQPPRGRLRQPGRDLQMPSLRTSRQPLRRRAPRSVVIRSSPTTKATRTPCSAPPRSTTWRRSAKTKPRAWPSSCPTVNIPIGVPVAVRSGSDYGLKMSSQQHLPDGRAAGAEFTIWGFPADPNTTPNGSTRWTRRTARLPRQPAHGLHSRRRTRRPGSGQALHRQPERLHRRRTAGVASTSVSYQDPSPPRDRSPSYPETTGCENQRFDPVFNLGLTTAEADAPSGLDIQLQSRAVPRGRSTVAVDPALRDADACPGPDDQPRCGRRADSCTRRRGRASAPTCRAAARTTRRSARVEVITPALDAPLDRLALHRPAAARQPVPAVHDVRRLRRPREARRRRPPGPGDRPG